MMEVLNRCERHHFPYNSLLGKESGYRSVAYAVYGTQSKHQLYVVCFSENHTEKSNNIFLASGEIHGTCAICSLHSQDWKRPAPSLSSHVTKLLLDKKRPGWVLGTNQQLATMARSQLALLALCALCAVSVSAEITQWDPDCIQEPVGFGRGTVGGEGGMYVGVGSFGLMPTHPILCQSIYGETVFPLAPSQGECRLMYRDMVCPACLPHRRFGERPRLSLLCSALAWPATALRPQASCARRV